MSGSIYLGNTGAIELQRTTINTPLTSALDPSDVNLAANRFSFDFDEAALITGDYITIRSTDGSNLELIAGHAFPDWAGCVHIDDAGGIRLFPSFDLAIAGERSDSILLQAPTATQQIEVLSVGRRFRYLAKITDYSITTSREAVDLTSLGEEHRRHYASGLISGQGSLSCFWDFRYEMCDGLNCLDSELSHYLAQLILRVKQGASFRGRFFLLNSAPDFVWYDAPLCIVTNVAIAVNAQSAIKAQIDFVTSGPIHLRTGQPPSHILLEDSDLLLQEDGSKLELEDS